MAKRLEELNEQELLQAMNSMPETEFKNTLLALQQKAPTLTPQPDQQSPWEAFLKDLSNNKVTAAQLAKMLPVLLSNPTYVKMLSNIPALAPMFSALDAVSNKPRSPFELKNPLNTTYTR